MKVRHVMAVAADHPAFAGHFPAYPVLPGAILLDEMLRIAARELTLDLTRWQIASAKFLNVVRPGDAPLVEYVLANDDLIRFNVLVADRSVANGTLTRTPAALR
jgi:3-hydroxyacyl-[acyl-carrier-protein] dehydratase